MKIVLEAYRGYANKNTSYLSLISLKKYILLNNIV